MVLLPITAEQNAWARSAGYSSYDEYMSIHMQNQNMAAKSAAPTGSYVPPHILRQQEAQQQGFSSVREMWAAKGYHMPEDAGDNWVPPTKGEKGWVAISMPKGTTKGVKGGNWRKPGATVMNNGQHVHPDYCEGGSQYFQVGLRGNGTQVPHGHGWSQNPHHPCGMVSGTSHGPGGCAYDPKGSIGVPIGTNPKGGEQGYLGKAGKGNLGNPGKGIVGTHSTHSGDQQVWWNRAPTKGDSIVAPKGNPKGGAHDKSR